MKQTMSLFFVLFLFATSGVAQTEFNLETSQIMLMTGKGQGQDGAINPYYGQDCIAVVENLGNSEFSIRIEKRGEFIQEIPILGMETKRIKLLKGQELYVDGNTEAEVNLMLDFEGIEED